jgi:hypothetical protein
MVMRERSGHGWLRRIACSAEAAETALANMNRFMPPLLRQAADLDPVPGQDALDEVCRRFAAAGGVAWFLGGSAALAVRGASVRPHDLDLIVSDADSVRVGELLADGILEPVARGEWPLEHLVGPGVPACKGGVGWRHDARRRSA